MTFFAGDVLSAADLNDIIAPGWVDYSGTFTLTAVTTNPTKGNSTYQAYYRRSATSDVCDVQIYIVIGSTFSAGSGAYRFLVPFTSLSTELMTAHAFINESGVALRVGAGQFVDTTHFEMIYDAAGGIIGSGGLSTSWTTGDSIKISLRYGLA